MGCHVHFSVRHSQGFVQQWHGDRCSLQEGCWPEIGKASRDNQTGQLNGAISDIYALSRETIRAQDLEEFASVDLVKGKAVRMILTGDLLFDTGKADLKWEARGSLE